MRKLFIYGFGYTAKYLVDQFNDNFSKIVGYTRNKEVIANGNKFVDLIDHSNMSECLLNNDFSPTNATWNSPDGSSSWNPRWMGGSTAQEKEYKTTQLKSKATIIY